MKNTDFNPIRLKTSRLYRAKTIDQLAKETNINKKDIFAFEESKYLPTPENAMKMSKTLKFPLEYFYQKDNMKVLVENTHFAVPGSIPRVEEVAYRERLVMTQKIYSLMEKYVSLPKLNLPEKINKNVSIEDLANQVRRYWGLNDESIDNLADIMEKNGIIISEINSGKRGSASFTQKQIIDGELRYTVALGDDDKSSPKRNYDLAYELGYIISNKLGIPTKKFSKDEFACAFLLPKENFSIDLKNPEDLNSYIELKRTWIVPISIMIFRAHQLEILSYKKYNNLAREMEKQGWLRQEPLEGSMEAENPKLLRNIPNKLKDSNLMNSDIVELLSNFGISLNKEDIDTLLGLKSEISQSKPTKPRKKR